MPSSFYRLLLIACLGVGLVACDAIDEHIPHVLTDEVPPEMRAEPRPVPVPPPPPEHRDWPLAADVPQMPKDFTPKPSIDAAKTQMQNDRNEAEIMRQNYESAPPVVTESPQSTASP